MVLQSNKPSVDEASDLVNPGAGYNAVERPFIVPERRIAKVVVTYEQRMVCGSPSITQRTELYRDCGHVSGWAGMPHRRPQVGDKDGCLTCACKAEDES